MNFDQINDSDVMEEQFDFSDIDEPKPVLEISKSKESLLSPKFNDDKNYEFDEEYNQKVQWQDPKISKKKEVIQQKDDIYDDYEDDFNDDYQDDFNEEESVKQHQNVVQHQVQPQKVVQNQYIKQDEASFQDHSFEEEVLSDENDHYLQQEKLQQEKLQQEKLQQEKLQNQRLQKEKQQQERLYQEKLQYEKQQQQEREQEKYERELLRQQQQEQQQKQLEQQQKQQQQVQQQQKPPQKPLQKGQKQNSQRSNSQAKKENQDQTKRQEISYQEQIYMLFESIDQLQPEYQNYKMKQQLQLLNDDLTVLLKKVNEKKMVQNAVNKQKNISTLQKQKIQYSEIENNQKILNNQNAEYQNYVKLQQRLENIESQVQMQKEIENQQKLIEKQKKENKQFNIKINSKGNQLNNAKVSKGEISQIHKEMNLIEHETIYLIQQNEQMKQKNNQLEQTVEENQYNQDEMLGKAVQLGNYYEIKASKQTVHFNQLKSQCDQNQRKIQLLKHKFSTIQDQLRYDINIIKANANNIDLNKIDQNLQTQNNMILQISNKLMQQQQILNENLNMSNYQTNRTFLTENKPKFTRVQRNSSQDDPKKKQKTSHRILKPAIKQSPNISVGAVKQQDLKLEQNYYEDDFENNSDHNSPQKVQQPEQMKQESNKSEKKANLQLNLQEELQHKPLTTNNTLQNKPSQENKLSINMTNDTQQEQPPKKVFNFAKKSIIQDNNKINNQINNQNDNQNDNQSNDNQEPMIQEPEQPTQRMINFKRQSKAEDSLQINFNNNNLNLNNNNNLNLNNNNNLNLNNNNGLNLNNLNNNNVNSNFNKPIETKKDPLDFLNQPTQRKQEDALDFLNKPTTRNENIVDFSKIAEVKPKEDPLDFMNKPKDNPLDFMNKPKQQNNDYFDFLQDKQPVKQEAKKDDIFGFLENNDNNKKQPLNFNDQEEVKPKRFNQRQSQMNQQPKKSNFAEKAENGDFDFFDGL